MLCCRKEVSSNDLETMKIPYLDLYRDHKQFQMELDHVLKESIMESKFINGPAVQQFCLELSEYMNGLHVIPCGNGTDALQLSLMALNLEIGDKVAVPTFTYIASAEVIALLKLTPILVDVEVDSFNIDPIDLEAKLKAHDIKVVIPVHLYGQSANMKEIMLLKERYGFAVVEDNAQALGSSTLFYGTKRLAGSFGEFSTTSFFPTKVLGCMGDGGAVFTHNDRLFDYCRKLANHGQSKKYHHDFVGVNSRLDTLQAAILSLKLKRLATNLRLRQELAEVFDQELGTVSWVKVPFLSEGNTHVYHQYTLRVLEDKRDRLQLFLRDNDIPSTVYYPVPMHLQKGYKHLGHKIGDFPVAEQLTKEVLSIPIFPYMTAEERHYVVETIKSFEG